MGGAAGLQGKAREDVAPPPAPGPPASGLEQHLDPPLTWEALQGRGPARPGVAHWSPEKATGNCGLGSTTWERDFRLRRRE